MVGAMIRTADSTPVFSIEGHGLSAEETSASVMQLPPPPVIDFGKQEAFNVGMNLFGAATSGVMTYALFRALSRDPSLWWKIVFALGAVSSGVATVTYLYQGVESAT
jgi:hypothetical protein